jgi:MoaA/NifB/PqqE/SkfB family radical SAM enzyme
LYADVAGFIDACKQLRELKRFRAAGREQEGVPYSVVLSLTEKCDGNCPGCFAPYFGEPELTLTELAEVFNALRGLGVRRLSFGGGEPTKRRQLKEILQSAKDRALLTSMSTNGMTLAREPDRIRKYEGVLDEVIVDYHSTLESVAMKFSPYMNKEHLARIEELFSYTLANTSIQLKVATVMFKGNSDLEDLQRIADMLVRRKVRIWKIDQYYHVPDDQRAKVDESDLATDGQVWRAPESNRHRGTIQTNTEELRDISGRGSFHQ